ncbi:hypothetical protein GGR57DRAFT_446391 [Xylariaceae sp. FL1272]|nr:hypothetical protein GGR57DRAFT_446391 [Xylariaceae sp. FL1272]
MPDENPGLQSRPFPRSSRSSNTPAPTLPSLRSLNTRPLPPIHTPGVSGRAHQMDRALGRSHDMDPLEWNGSGEDAIDSWDRDFDAEESRDMHDVRRLGLTPVGHSRSPFNDSAPDRPEIDLLSFAHTPPHHLTDLFSPGSQEPEESRRKRRKVDPDRLCPHFQGFNYGKFGQVHPGQLQMELVSCDGGIYLDNKTSYAAENILKNDKSVYCTEDSRCNIVLRHQGATVFTLKELIIKAPKCNFDSPVQAGMVFVSMTYDHLLNRTAQYQIQYAPPRSSSRSMEREAPPVVSIRHSEDGTTMTRAQVRARRLYNIGMDDEDNEVGIAQIPSEFNTSQPHFQVTNERSDDDDEDGTNDARGGRANHISDSDSSDDTLNDFSMGTATHRLRRRRRLINAANSALSEAVEAAQVATQEAVRAVGGELMKPSARFHIAHNKSKCTIQFDPPVSGRFILLKMWNPRRHANENIDIQAVIAQGYAGPRFCPSIELR